MNVFTTIKETETALDQFRINAKTIGFVPTMGALHQGHLELMMRAKNENDILAVSIFVNPIQFNNPEDLKKYPRDLDKDKKLLEEVGCDVLFSPDVKEMYPEEVQTKYDFGKLETVMEGSFRVGHFNGVAVVVKKLFDIIKPNKAYFGEKDFNNWLSFKNLLNLRRFLLKLYPVPLSEKETVWQCHREISDYR